MLTTARRRMRMSGFRTTARPEFKLTARLATNTRALEPVHYLFALGIIARCERSNTRAIFR